MTLILLSDILSLTEEFYKIRKTLDIVFINIRE